MVVLAIYFINILNFAYAYVESLSIPTNSFLSTHFEEPQSYHIDINILVLTFYNEMGPKNKDVSLYYNNKKDAVHLSSGQDYLKLDNLNGSKSAIIYWNRNCISFLAYDPSTERNNHKIHWMIAEDGLLHSVDNIVFKKMKSWTNHC